MKKQLRKFGKGGWDSVECGMKGGGCYPHGSVENIGFASWLFGSCVLTLLVRLSGIVRVWEQKLEKQ